MSATTRPMVPPATVTIVLADDHAVVRSGLRLLLEAENDFHVVAEAADADAALRGVLGHKPSVLVLDLAMPGGRTSLEAIPLVRERCERTAVVVLTMEEDPSFARRALQAGALGYVLKDSADAELVEAVRRAAVGETYVAPRLGAALAAQPASDGAPPDDLTPREVEVLRLIALGHTNAEIGAQLYVSVRTVESHRAHIQQKLRRSSRADLVRYALDRGLLAGDGGRRGRSRAPSCPRSGAESSSSWPPTRRTRSRIPIRPKPSVSSSRREAAAVVADLDLDPARALAHAHVDGGRARVLGHVRQRLLHEPVDRRLDRRVQARRLVGDLERTTRCRARCARPPRSTSAVERGGDAELVQRGRSQVGDQAAHRADARVDVLDRPLDGGGERRAVGAPRRGEAQLERRRAPAASRRAARAPSGGARARRPRRCAPARGPRPSARSPRRSPRSPRRPPAGARPRP